MNLQEVDALLATGPNPATETWHIEAAADSGTWTGLRIEVLPDAYGLHAARWEVDGPGQAHLDPFAPDGMSVDYGL